MHLNISTATLLHDEPTMYLEELAMRFQNVNVAQFHARFPLDELQDGAGVVWIHVANA